jgi:hypothetical protein
MALFGLYLVACGLLVGAGAAKALRPHDTARALAEVIAPGRSWVTIVAALRALAVIEATLGGVGIVVPNPVTASLVALSYAGFGGFVLYARAKGGALASCGCFAAVDTPPTITHAVIDGVCGVAAAVFAWSGHTGFVTDIVSHQYGHGAPLLVASAVCGWLAYLVMSGLARLAALRGEAAVTSGPRS